MRALVTGCAGFIGYHLAESLLESGHTVVGLDNLSSGQERNVTDLRRYEQFEFEQVDLSETLPSFNGKFDRIYNLACPASPKDFTTLRLEILHVCSRGVLNLLDLAREHGARLLHTSTSEVYGDPQQHPQTESYWGNVNPIGPRACYDEGKRFAEALITSYADVHGVEARMVRIFNTYGPRMRGNDGRVLPNFISQALSGEPLTVYGDGSQTRSFCFVDDMVAGILKLADSDVTQPVNIGNPSEVSIRAFAEEIIALTGSRSELVELERPQDDPQLRCPDITVAREQLGWSPKVDRSAGLQRTIEWFKALHAEAH